MHWNAKRFAFECNKFALTRDLIFDNIRCINMEVVTTIMLHDDSLGGDE